MSQDNLDLGRRSIDAINGRDLDALLALTDDDVEGISRLLPIEGEIRGHDGTREWWHNLFEIWPDFGIEVLELGTVGDLTIAALRLHGRGAGSGIPSVWEVCLISRWKDGKCVWWGSFPTRAEALEAAGLEE